MDVGQIRAEIEPLIRTMQKPANRSVYGIDCGWGLYRGQRKFYVGYSWTRPYSHYASGLVYKARVAWGDSAEEAIANLKKKAV
jgi:hypothetical protein